MLYGSEAIPVVDAQWQDRSSPRTLVPLKRVAIEKALPLFILSHP